MAYRCRVRDWPAFKGIGGGGEHGVAVLVLGTFRGATLSTTAATAATFARPGLSGLAVGIKFRFLA